MITIKYGTAYSTVSSNSVQEERLVRYTLDNTLAVRVPGYFFTPAYLNGGWDGYDRLFKRKTGKFPTGLLARVLKIVRKMEADVEVIGFPEPWPGWEDLASVTLEGGFELRDYQVHVIKQILKFHRGIVKVATNGGKTEIWAGLMKILGSPPSIFYVPRQVILQQTVERFQERLGTRVGMVGAGVWDPNPDGVTVVLYHSLHKKLKTEKKWLNRCVAVAADECHMLSADGYRDCFDATGGDFRIGMSGTPFNRDKEVQRARLIGATGAVLADVSNTELIDRGISERPNILILTPKTRPEQKSMLKDADYRDAIQFNINRNKIIAILAKAFVRQGMQTLVMVARTNHGLAIQEWLPEGVLCTSATGNRKEVKERLQDGDVFSCICTSIFDTGLSVDHIQGMINAAEGSSEQTVLQRAGRTLRKKYDKNLWIVDFMDDFNNHTKNHSESRIRTYKSQAGFTMIPNWRDAPLSDQDRYELISLVK